MAATAAATAASMAAGSAIATRVATSPVYLSRTSRSWFGATGRLASQYGYRGCKPPDMARSIAQRASGSTLDMVRHNSVLGGSETTRVTEESDHARGSPQHLQARPPRHRLHAVRAPARRAALRYRALLAPVAR